MLSLKIPGNIIEQMVHQAKAEAPVESCGILAGRSGQVEKLYQMKNTDQNHDHFMMAPEEQFKVVKDIRAVGLEMLAIYHSHPESPARPSVEDVRLALTQGVIYVIVSLQNTEPVIKGFIIEDNNVTEVPVKIKAEYKND
jgi:proteasome lid subunit RPN8/RPN11